MTGANWQASKPRTERLTAIGIALLAGIQPLSGPVLIGRSASFTRLAMERFRDLQRHPGRGGG